MLGSLTRITGDFLGHDFMRPPLSTNANGLYRHPVDL
jgi:hypothetical protein